MVKLMEKCHYCGYEYHPMLRATKGGKLICVCEFYYDEDLEKLITKEECKKKAIADGYKLRRDLTPSR